MVRKCLFLAECSILKMELGDPYHGYWIQDSTQLNEKFGTADDLQALSAEIHRRDMYLMVRTLY